MVEAETITEKRKMGKWTRRGLIAAGLLGGGVLAVGIAIRPGHQAKKLAQFVAGKGESLVTAWIKLSPDNVITAIVPHGEMGQGVNTALGQLVAEEMDADWSKLVVEQAPAIDGYANHFVPKEYLAPGIRPPGLVEDTINGVFMQIARSMHFQTTGGSSSIRWTGRSGIQVAAAAAREMLLNAAALKWGVPVSQLRTENSMIVHDASKRSEPYAAFAAEAATHVPPLHPKMKAAKDYKVIGQPVPRFDIPSKVDGTAKFAIDIDVPGMKYAAVKASPVIGGKVKSMDTAAARKMPGVVDVLNMDGYVAVVANGYWQAKQALDAVQMTYESSPKDGLDSAAIFAGFRKDMDAAVRDGDEQVDIETGTARDLIAKSGQAAMKAEYQVPYLAHATMEPMTAVASVTGDKAEVWTGTQNPLGIAHAVADALELDAAQVKVHNQLMGGGFGRRARPDYPVQAAMISKAVKAPIKLIWSREEDMAQDHYRCASISRFSAALDAKGMPLAWENQYVHKNDPKEASQIPYNIPNQYIHYAETENPIRFGAWRSVDHSQHGFFIESFIDELAHKAGQDPYRYRRQLLAGKPRHIAVLDAAAKGAGWNSPPTKGVGRGIALVESFGTIVAEVAEVDMTNGAPVVTKVTCAADPGLVVNPDGFAAQMESGIMFGLTAALFGEITIKNGAAEQSNFDSYEMIRMNNTPEISVILINGGGTTGGAGEPGTPPIAPAVTNALFAASGKRVRTLPVKNFAFT